MSERTSSLLALAFITQLILISQVSARVDRLERHAKTLEHQLQELAERDHLYRGATFFANK